MKYIITIICSITVFLTANMFSISFVQEHWYLKVILTILFMLINIFPSLHKNKAQTIRLRVCKDGVELLVIFLLSSLSTFTYLISISFWSISSVLSKVLIILCAIIVEAIIFWNGILRIYSTSLQIGIKWRIIGIICGWIPLVNLFVLVKLIRIASRETKFENEKIIVNNERKEMQRCRTKYPILLVHGVFFRDSKYFNYWGRIPKELKKNGAKIYYGNHQSAASVIDSGKELADRIREIVKDTGCKKVNIIAHSKGGLDCRYAISKFGVDEYVASLTTINTPHYGCQFADSLLSKFPEKTKDFVAQKYNTTLKKFGDSNPDFLAAVNDLTANACKQFNDIVHDIPSVFYQSVGSKLKVASSGRFPLNFCYPLVKHFDGENDGLVSVDSFGWGKKEVILTSNGRRGISHGDVIDLNRENIEGFDVREFYVDLVYELKERGF